MTDARSRRFGATIALALLAAICLAPRAADAHSRTRVLPAPARSAPAPDVAPPAAPPAERPALDPRPPAVWTATPAASPAPWLAIAGALALGGVIARRSRRAVALAVALVLTLFLAESMVHSVHHLADARGAAHCQMLSVAQHLAGDAPATAADATGPLDSGPLATTTPDSSPSAGPVCPDQGRAPPVRSA
jgi:hypothetical protein